MIPQPFVKGAGERVFFGPYEYPDGADLIFDFGNPICTSAFGSNIVYNVGSANVTGSLIPYNNPGPIYPTLSAAAGGVMITQEFAFGSNYLEWDWKSTENQTNVFIFALNGAQLNPWSSFLPQEAGASSIRANVYGNTVITGSASLDVRFRNSSNQANDIFSTTLNVDISNTRNGYNMIGITANNSTSHNLYINPSLVATDATNITRTTSGTQNTDFGVSSNMRIMSFLQYPKVLTPKEIRQIYKVFSRRFFL
jgi:hypothetical protein